MAGESSQEKLPEIGQWPDKVAPAAIAGGILLTTLGFLLAFFYAGPVNGASVGGAELIGDQVVTTKLLISQKIFYFHMPVAITSMVVMVFMAYYSVRYLLTRQQRYDTCACLCMEAARLFVLCTMLTGEMWPVFEWGVWWKWEQRLTTYLDDSERRAAFAAVFGLVSFLDVPITLFITRLIPSSLHPVVLREGGMTPDMALTVGVCVIGFLLLAFGLYRLRFRNARLQERITVLKDAFDNA